MRGQLKIASQRSPYRRAGLAWPTSDPVLADIRTLDGARLLALVDDPVLSVLVGVDDDNFRPFPAPTPGEQHKGWTLQLIIDAMKEELPPIEEPLPESDGAGSTALIEELRGEVVTAQDLARLAATELLEAKNTITALTNERDGATSRAVDLERHLSTRTGERDTATGRVTSLEAEVAKLKAALATKAPKQKPAGTGNAP